METPPKHRPWHPLRHVKVQNLWSDWFAATISRSTVLQDWNNLAVPGREVKSNQASQEGALGILFIGPSSWGMSWEYFIPQKPVSQSEHRGRLGQGSGEMGLSAAVSVCCTVWKSSVMAYLMVIVWSGESPLLSACWYLGGLEWRRQRQQQWRGGWGRCWCFSCFPDFLSL